MAPAGFLEAYNALPEWFKRCIPFGEWVGGRSANLQWHRVVGTRLGGASGPLAFFAWAEQQFIDGVPAHFLSNTCRMLREFLDRDGPDQELAPLYLLQIELDAADFSSNPPAGPVPAPLNLPPVANFFDNAPSVPPPPPAAPPIPSETGITSEVIAAVAQFGRGTAKVTTFSAMRCIDLPVLLLGDVSGPSLADPGDPRPHWEFRGTERNLLERFREVLVGLLTRDQIAQDDSPTKKISTRDLFFADDASFAACNLLLSQVTYLLGLQKV